METYTLQLTIPRYAIRVPLLYTWIGMEANVMTGPGYRGEHAQGGEQGGP